MTSKNVRVFELKLGKRALILFIAGMSCLLFVVFLFGVTVGKDIDTYPEKYSRGFRGMMMEKLGWSSNRAETAVAAGETADRNAKAGVEEIAPEEKKAPAAAAVPPSEEKQPSDSCRHANGNKAACRAGEISDTGWLFQGKGKSGPVMQKTYGPRVLPQGSRNAGAEKGKWMRITLEGFESREDAQKAAERVARKNQGIELCRS